MRMSTILSNLEPGASDSAIGAITKRSHTILNRQNARANSTKYHPDTDTEKDKNSTAITGLTVSKTSASGFLNLKHLNPCMSSYS